VTEKEEDLRVASMYVSSPLTFGDKCIVVQGDYFEGNVVIVDYNMAHALFTVDN
jgi:hypothetical protein